MSSQNEPLVLPRRPRRAKRTRHDEEALALPASRKMSGYCNGHNKPEQHELCDGILGGAPKVYRCPCPCHQPR